MRNPRPAVFVIGVIFIAGAIANVNGQVQDRLPQTRVRPTLKNALVEDLPKNARLRLGTAKLRLGEPLRAALLSADGKNLIAASSNKLILFNAQTGDRIRKINKGYVNFRSITMSPDGKQLALSSYSNSIQLLDVATGQPVRAFQSGDRNHRLDQSEFSQDGKQIAVCPEDYYSSTKQNRPVYVWEVPSGKQLAALPVIHARQVKVAFAPDGNALATFGSTNQSNPQAIADNMTIQLWDIKTAKEIRRLQANRQNIRSAAFSPNGKLFAAVSGRSTVTLWDVKTGAVLRRFAGRAASGAVIKFSPESDFLVVANSSGMVQLWDTKTWKRHDAVGPTCVATDVAFSSTGEVVACGIHGQAINIWNVKTGKSLAPQHGHQHYVKAIEFSQDGRSVMTVDQAGKICYWNATSGNELKHHFLNDLDSTAPSGSSSYYRLAVSKNLQYLAAQYSNGIRLWDLRSQKVVCDIEGSSSSSIAALDLSRTNDKVAFMDSTTAISIWDIQSGEELQSFKIQKGGQRFSINTAEVAFSPHGERLAASCYYYDGGIGRTIYVACLWDTASGKELLRLNLPSGMPTLDFAPDGSTLAIGSSTGVILYNPRNGKELKRLVGNGGQFACLRFSPDGRTIAAAVQTYSSSTQMAVISVWEVATGQLRTQFSGHAGPILTMNYSHDGAILASGGYDTSILMWDLTGQHDTPKPSKVTAQELEVAWNALTNANSSAAFSALARLIASADVTLDYLGKHVQPAKREVISDKTMQRLIDDLDSPRYRIREKATHRLKLIGKPAIPLLQKALRISDPLEMQQRIRLLLEGLEFKVLPAKELRDVRAVEILERIGTPSARHLLVRLAEGAPQTPLTEHAQAALRRMQKAGN